MPEAEQPLGFPSAGAARVVEQRRRWTWLETDGDSGRKRSVDISAMGTTTIPAAVVFCFVFEAPWCWRALQRGLRSLEMFCRCLKGDPLHPEEEPGRKSGRPKGKEGMEVGAGQMQRPGLNLRGRGGDGHEVRTGREHPIPRRRARAGAAHRRVIQPKGQAGKTSSAEISWR